MVILYHQHRSTYTQIISQSTMKRVTSYKQTLAVLQPSTPQTLKMLSPLLNKPGVTLLYHRNSLQTNLVKTQVTTFLLRKWGTTVTKDIPIQSERVRWHFTTPWLNMKHQCGQCRHIYITQTQRSSQHVLNMHAQM